MRGTMTFDNGSKFNFQVDRVSDEFLWGVFVVHTDGKEEKIRYGTAVTMTAAVQKCTSVILDNAT